MALIRFPQQIGKNELMNGSSCLFPILSDNKAFDCNKLMITTSEAGSQRFLIALEGSIILWFRLELFEFGEHK